MWAIFCDILRLYFSCFSDCDTNEDPLLNSSIDEVNDKPSFTAKSFYGNSCTTPRSRAKLPFYLRYSLGDSNLENHSEASHLADVTNISETGLHSVPEGHWKVDTGTPPQSTTASGSRHPEGSRLASGVQHRRRPCYYIEPSKRLKYTRSPQQESSTKAVREDVIKSIGIENIGVVMPRTAGNIMDSPTTADNGGGCGSERKFFKNRPASIRTSQSPTSTRLGRAGSTTVVCRGFNLNFVPRQLSTSFEKKRVRRKERKSRNSRPLRRRKGNSNSCTEDEKPLPPLSNIFPELDLQPLSSATAAPSPTNTCDHLVNPRQQSADQLSTAEDHCSNSNSCGSTSSLVLFSSDSNSSENSNPPGEFS